MPRFKLNNPKAHPHHDWPTLMGKMAQFSMMPTVASASCNGCNDNNGSGVTGANPSFDSLEDSTPPVVILTTPGDGPSGHFKIPHLWPPKIPQATGLV